MQKRRQLIKASEQGAGVAEGQLCVRANCSMWIWLGLGVAGGVAASACVFAFEHICAKVSAKTNTEIL